MLSCEVQGPGRFKEVLLLFLEELLGCEVDGELGSCPDVPEKMNDRNKKNSTIATTEMKNRFLEVN